MSLNKAVCCAVRPNPRTAPCAQLPQTLRATICSTRNQGRRSNSLRSDNRDSVGLLRSPQTLTAPCFEAAADERQGRCGGSGLGLAATVVDLTP
jgi:hypothetical protein